MHNPPLQKKPAVTTGAGSKLDASMRPSPAFSLAKKKHAYNIDSETAVTTGAGSKLDASMRPSPAQRFGDDQHNGFVAVCSSSLFPCVDRSPSPALLILNCLFDLTTTSTTASSRSVHLPSVDVSPLRSPSLARLLSLSPSHRTSMWEDEQTEGPRSVSNFIRNTNSSKTRLGVPRCCFNK